MSNVNAEIKWQGNDNAWFSTNASTVYPANIQIFHTDGRYKFTDGVTTLGALSFLGGSTYTLTASEIGSVINSANSATPNDTDLVMSVDTSVAKKNTWTQIKTFLKTYFDTVYATITDLTGYVKKGTLTTNTIPKATSSDTIGNSNIIDDGTNVGIGTSSPGAKLHVKGSTNDYTAFAFSFYNSNQTANFVMRNDGVSAFNGSYDYDVSLQVGNSTNKTYPFRIKNYADSPILAVNNNGVVNLANLTPSQIVETDASKNLVSVACYTESFAYTGSPFTLTKAPNYIFSIRTTSMVLDESDVNDVTIVGTTLTVINPAFQSGETLYIKYKG